VYFFLLFAALFTHTDNKEATMESPPHFQSGDQVRTMQRLHRLPAGSVGTVKRIFGTGDLLGVLFPGNRVPRFVYRDQIEVLRPPNERV
jgi:hypothetical protein